MKAKSFYYGKLLAISSVIFAGLYASAQPLPPIGNPAPPPPMGVPNQAPPPNTPPSPPPPPPPGWGGPGFLASQPFNTANQGTINVMATGYDTESVLVQIPLVVAYSYNGAYYDVTVLNSWNPYTQSWNVGIDSPAYQTDYYFNGFTYNYYANLPTGTFYFNL